MAPRQDARHKRSAPRLYLVTDAVGDADAFARAAPEILAAADVAAVLLRLPDAAEAELSEIIARVARPVQAAGVALILDAHPELAAKSLADGAHLTGVETLKTSLGILKPRLIAGAGGLKTRHDAMTAGESGADYVMFGEPDADGRRPSFDAVLERVAWWSEVFEIPCVGFAQSLEEVGPLARAGAEFVALGGFMWNHSDGSAAALREAARHLRHVEVV